MFTWETLHYLSFTQKPPSLAANGLSENYTTRSETSFVCSLTALLLFQMTKSQAKFFSCLSYLSVAAAD